MTYIDNMPTLIVMLVGVSLLSWWLLGRLIVVLEQRKILDHVNERTLHQGSIARGGGLVIIAMLIISLLVLGYLSGRYALMGSLAIVIAAWGSVSWRDDLEPLSARYRLGFHFIFTLLMIYVFGHISNVQISSQQSIWLAEFGYLATFIGVIWFANLYNFMDGLDGLAATQTIIAAISLGFWFWQSGDPELALFCVVLASISYGFLLRNLRPAQIFLGDVGSITLGALFATFIIYGVVNYQIPVISFVLLFGVFVFDASVTILVRIRRGEKFWLAHRTHYYQRLATAGMGHGRILIIQTVLMLVCSTIASITVLDHDRILLAVLIEFILLCLAAVFVSRFERSQISTL